jgi:hypothetical protein
MNEDFNYAPLVTVADHLKLFRDLTNRDVFAIAALVGICSNGLWSTQAAEMAYDTADEMLKAREAK